MGREEIRDYVEEERMKIPKKLKIGGHWVKILQVDKLPAEIADCGMSQVATNKIWIARKMEDGEKIPEDVQLEVLLHEVTHHILMQAGYGTKEGIVTAIGAGFYQVLHDNKIGCIHKIRRLK